MVLNFDKKVVSLNIIYFYTLHIVLLYKGNKTVWMFYEKFLTRETTLCSPNINDIDRDYKVYPGLQPLTTGSVVKICGVFFRVFMYLYFLYWKLSCYLLQNKTKF
jgi:hypothetical protein